MEPLTHKIGSTDPEWNESYYFIFYDKINNIGGMNRAGFKPNKPEGMTFFFMFLPDDTVAAYHQTDDCSSYPDSLSVAGVTHQPNSDGSWDYRLNGSMIVVDDPEILPNVRTQPELIKDLVDVDLNLHFAPIHKEYEYSEHMTELSLELGKNAGDMHWEQIAKITGTIQFGETTYKIKECIGQRDHTFGIRDWTGIDNWFYFVVWFNENLAVNPAAILMDDGRLSTGGFLYRDGENIPLRDIRIVSHEFRQDGIFPETTKMELVDMKGETHVLKAKAGRIIPVPFTDNLGRQSILVQSFGSFELDDIKGGYGSYETLRRVDEF